MLAKLEQYEVIDRIVRCTCDAGGLSYLDFISRKKSTLLNTLRGVACVISRFRQVHPSVAAQMFCRTRCNVITEAKRYHHYLQVRDKAVTQYYDTINDMIDEYE